MAPAEALGPASGSGEEFLASQSIKCNKHNRALEGVSCGSGHPHLRLPWGLDLLLIYFLREPELVHE